MKFHITITDNETGETLVDIDTGAIIGAIDEGEGTRTINITKCKGVELCATVAGALHAANQCLDRMPTYLRKEILKLTKKK